MNDKFLTAGDGKVIGMVHLQALPGTKNFQDNLDEVYRQALQDAKTLEEAGVDALMVENMGDVPFAEILDVEQTAALAAISARIKDEVNIPIGIDAAFNDYKAALAIAKSVDAAFVRIPVFVDTVVFDGGIVEPCARKAVAYRQKLKAENVEIYADVQVKHSHPLLTSVSIEESAKNAEMAGADAVIVTGTAIGSETPIELIKNVRKSVSIPLIVGSGVNAQNIAAQLADADGAIVGSSLKEGGLHAPVSKARTKELMNALRGDGS